VVVRGRLGFVLQCRRIDVRDSPEAGEVKRPGDSVELILADVQLVDEQLDTFSLMSRLLPVAPRVRSGDARARVEGLQQVVYVVFVDREVLVRVTRNSDVSDDIQARGIAPRT